MEDIWDVPRYEKFVFDLQTPKHAFTQMSPMSVEDQHEWLEARRVTLQSHMELALVLNDAVPDWLLTEWYRLQRARDTLLHHRICQDNWALFVRELGRVGSRLASLLRWPVCDSWDTRQLRQLSSDWLLVGKRLNSSRYHRHHALPVQRLPDPPDDCPARRVESPHQIRSPGLVRTPVRLPDPPDGCPARRVESPHQIRSPGLVRPPVPVSPVGLVSSPPLRHCRSSPACSPLLANSWRRTSSYVTP